MRDNRSDAASTLPHHYASETTQVHSSTQTSTRARRGATMATISAMLPKRLVRVALLTCLLVTTALVYVTLFKHPPPDQVLKMNSGAGKSFNMRAFGNFEKSHAARELQGSENEAADDNDDDDNENGGEEEEGERNILDLLDDDDDDEEDERAREEKEERKSKENKSKERKSKERKSKSRKSKEGKSKSTVPRSKDDKSDEGRRAGEVRGKAAWDRFIADNHHTVIGIVFDRCENPTEQLGTVVLLPDTKKGGVMSRTFYNFTLEREIDEGWTFNIDVKYNGQDLYDNWWEVCEMEEDLDPEDRTFICPVKPGRQSLVKDKHIPGYIPKGRYQTKAWVKDSNSTVLVCGYSDFVL